MMGMREKWAVMIEITNLCGHNCLYCCKHTRHLRANQFYYMGIDEIREALRTVKEFPGKIGITGGEPLLHPEIVEVMEMIRGEVGKEKVMVFTSNRAFHMEYKKEIDETFGEVYVNYHTDEQKRVCKHQPLLLAVGDVVKEKEVQDALIDNCWCDRMWSPIMGKNGAFFCDCALGLDTALDMGGGWKIEEGWWQKGEEEVRKQRDKYCYLCGMCVPFPGQSQDSEVELISEGLFDKFATHNLRNLKGMKIVNGGMSWDEAIRNTEGWEPWHNRQDRECGEGPEYVNC